MKVRKEKNLLSSSEAQEEEPEEVGVRTINMEIFTHFPSQIDIITSYWHPVYTSFPSPPDNLIDYLQNLTIALISDSGSVPYAGLAPPVRTRE